MVALKSEIAEFGSDTSVAAIDKEVFCVKVDPASDATSDVSALKRAEDPSADPRVSKKAASKYLGCSSATEFLPARNASRSADVMDSTLI